MGTIIGYLCLLIDLTQRKSKCSPVFLTGGSFKARSKFKSKLGFYTPTETWKEEPYLL